MYKIHLFQLHTFFKAVCIHKQRKCQNLKHPHRSQQQQKTAMKELGLKRIFQKRNISARLKCPICYDIFEKPRRLFCGHTFCKKCIKQYLKPHKNPQHVHTCPICRVPIDLENIGCDMVAKNIIDELKVRCPVNACHWIGQSQLLQTHYRFECQMKKYIQDMPNAKSISLIKQSDQENQDEVADQINKNTEKVPLLARVIAKNPHIISFNKSRQHNLKQKKEKKESLKDITLTKQFYEACVKTMVTIGTQTNLTQSNHRKIPSSQIDKDRQKITPISRIPRPPPYKKKQTLNSMLGSAKFIENNRFEQSSNYQQQEAPVPIINLQNSKAGSRACPSLNSDLRL